MSIYTIGDLHLSFNQNKPMSIFGSNWEKHEEKIKKSWLKKVKNDDLVILPGDFSWATYLKDTEQDFAYLNSLPGKKILSKGNHDYWWTTVTNMKKFIEEKDFKNIDFLYNNAYEFEKYIIAGARGWNDMEDEESKKIMNREVQRLEISLNKATEINKDKQKEILVFIHYPPITKSNILNNKTNQFIELMKKYNIKRCFYAHLHSTSILDAIQGKYFDIDFKLVSADGLDFKLLKIN